MGEGGLSLTAMSVKHHCGLHKALNDWRACAARRLLVRVLAASWKLSHVVMTSFGLLDNTLTYVWLWTLAMQCFHIVVLNCRRKLPCLQNALPFSRWLLNYPRAAHFLHGCTTRVRQMIWHTVSAEVDSVVAFTCFLHCLMGRGVRQVVAPAGP